MQLGAYAQGVACRQVYIALNLQAGGFALGDCAVDIVVAAIIAVAAAGPDDAPAITQVASGSANPLKYERLVDLVQRWFSDHPLYDTDGQPIEREASGFHARVVQHECDHLIGRLYPTRMHDLRLLGFTSVLFPDLDPARDDD